MHRSILIAPSLILLLALLVDPTLSASRIGTDGDDTLVGTKKDDQITGLGGNDQLKGLTGNDVYVFADDWGTDTVVERANQGRDTLDFHDVTGGPVVVRLIPAWVNADPTSNHAAGPGGEVLLAYRANGRTVQSVVENIIGGQGDHDFIRGGAGKNVLQPGGGGDDNIGDAGGNNDGVLPPIPASNDLYTGFADITGTDEIVDNGGTADVLDMRPFATTDVAFGLVDLDSDGTMESLQIVTDDNGPSGAQVVVVGQFGDVFGSEASNNYHGQIETIIFTDMTLTPTKASQVLRAASAGATSAKQRRLADAAEELADEARALIDPSDPLGLRPMRSKEAK